MAMKMNGTRKYHPEPGNPDPKGHAWYILTYKWISAIKIRYTDPKKLNKKEGPSEKA